MRRLFSIPSYRPPDEPPSRAASNWLLLSVVCAVAPHALRLPLWLTLTVAMGVGLRYGIDNHAWRVPPRWLQWILLAAVVLGILKTYGTFLGRDAGVAFLTAAVGLKVLEIRSLRDYLITVFLAFFLLVGAFLYSQSMMTAVYGVAVALLATATLALLNNAQGLSGLQVWKLMGRILLFGLPICLVMYVFFPRIQGSLWGLPSDAFSSRTGMTDEVRPGSFASLSVSTTPAFRVEFEGAPPEPEERYWRVYVLSSNENGTWRRRTMSAFDGPQPGGFEGTGPTVTYTVTLEPHNEHWLPVLDLPLDVPEGATPRHGFLVGSRNRVTRVIRYTSSSRQVARTAPLNLLEHRGNLRMDGQPSLRVAGLVRQWRGFSPTEKVDAALAYFREQPFRYTLTPPRLEGDDRIDRFLFETRSGYCEHYASAFVSLMRWSGVPARLLAGYQGGEWNESGGYLTVYQSDAHAWAEVWLPERGWARVDPTAAVAPERIELGAEAIRLLVEQGAALGELSDSEIRRLIARSWAQRLWLRTVWAWDNMNYLWNVWVMGYGPEVQRGFLRWLGFDTPTWTRMVAALAAGVAVLFMLAAIVITRQRVREDPVARLYRRALRKAAKSGFIKDPSEGPYDFQRRAERHAPELARRLKPVTEMYVRLRYAEDPSCTTSLFRSLVARF
jgi:transglutaminase-like putative cysteine protease